MNGIPIIISAPSGAGKGTVIPHVIKALPNAEYSVSCTTRAPRPGETDGRDYYFITRDQFEERIARSEMLEYNEYVGNLYGTPLREVREKLDAGRDIIFEVDVNGAVNIKRALPEAVSIMILPPSFDTLRSRLTGRGTDSPEAIAGRLSRAEQEIELLGEFDYYVINQENLADVCGADIVGIIESERKRTSRKTDIVNKFKYGESLI